MPLGHGDGRTVHDLRDLGASEHVGREREVIAPTVKLVVGDRHLEGGVRVAAGGGEGDLDISPYRSDFFIPLQNSSLIYARSSLFCQDFGVKTLRNRDKLRLRL